MVAMQADARGALALLAAESTTYRALNKRVNIVRTSQVPLVLQRIFQSALQPTER